MMHVLRSLVLVTGGVLASWFVGALAALVLSGTLVW